VNQLNYRHLYYFWVVAKEGGIARAADRLGMAVQTVGTQVHLLEQSLGYALLKPAGRGVALTDAGHAALLQADLIFQLGEQLPGLVRDAASTRVVHLSVGVSDGLPKMVVHHLLQPIVDEPNLRLQCQEDEFERLLGDLALHKLDVVLSDRPAQTSPNIKLYTHALGSSGISWYAARALKVPPRADTASVLSRFPVLLPTAHNALRLRLDRWFEAAGIAPQLAGEFEDNALLTTFGAGGMGVFPATDLVHDDLVAQYGVHRIGACDGVSEFFFAIGTERRVQHPLVQRLLKP